MAASRITCIVIAVLVMAVLSILIYPQIASELVSLSTAWRFCPKGNPDVKLFRKLG